jgi:hypothetical protein
MAAEAMPLAVCMHQLIGSVCKCVSLTPQAALKAVWTRSTRFTVVAAGHMALHATCDSPQSASGVKVCSCRHPRGRRLHQAVVASNQKPRPLAFVLVKIVQLLVVWVVESTAFGMGRRGLYELLPQV